MLLRLAAPRDAMRTWSPKLVGFVALLEAEGGSYPNQRQEARCFLQRAGRKTIRPSAQSGRASGTEPEELA